MSRYKDKAGEIGDGARPIPGVTAENYIQLANDFMESTGTAMDFARKAGASFMIQLSMHKQQTVWRHYFRKKGMSWRVAQMNNFLDEKGHYAVPAEWPWQFDQSVSEDMFR